MATDRARRPSSWLLVIALVVLSPSPLIAHAMTRGRCERDMSRTLSRLMADGELKPTGYESHSAGATARLMTFHAFDASVVPPGDVVTAFGLSVMLLLGAIAVFTTTTPRGTGGRAGEAVRPAR